MNILRNIILFGWMAIACTAFAQDRNADKVERPNTKKINFGIKAGFNSSMFMVSELKSTLVSKPDLILPCLWYPN